MEIVFVQCVNLLCFSRILFKAETKVRASNTKAKPKLKTRVEKVSQSTGCLNCKTRVLLQLQVTEKNKHLDAIKRIDKGLRYEFSLKKKIK